MSKLDEEAYKQWLYDLGRSIAKERRKQGLTQQKMADRTGFDLKYYQDLEYGRRPLTTRTLYQLTGGMGVKIIDLIKDLQGKKKGQK